MVSEGDVLTVEKLPEIVGGKVTFAEVLLVADDEAKEVKVGTPNIENAQVTAEIQRVVLHEIAHHFGIDDERLEELGM